MVISESIDSVAILWRTFSGKADLEIGEPSESSVSRADIEGRIAVTIVALQSRLVCMYDVARNELT